jgi:hypothetical protein
MLLLKLNALSVLFVYFFSITCSNSSVIAAYAIADRPACSSAYARYTLDSDGIDMIKDVKREEFPTLTDLVPIPIK